MSHWLSFFQDPTLYNKFQHRFLLYTGIGLSEQLTKVTWVVLLVNSSVELILRWNFFIGSGPDKSISNISDLIFTFLGDAWPEFQLVKASSHWSSGKNFPMQIVSNGTLIVTLNKKSDLKLQSYTFKSVWLIPQIIWPNNVEMYFLKSYNQVSQKFTSFFVLFRFDISELWPSEAQFDNTYVLWW